DNKEEEVDPNALNDQVVELEVESDGEEEWTDDEDEDDAELDTSSASDDEYIWCVEDVVGGVHLIQCTLYFCRSRVYADRIRLPHYADCPNDRICITPRSVTCLIPFSSRYMHETYDRTMEDRYAEGTPQQDLDPEAWVDIVGGPRKGLVYGFGDSLHTTPVLSSDASSVTPLANASSSAATPHSSGEDIRTLIREELFKADVCFFVSQRAMNLQKTSHPPDDQEVPPRAISRVIILTMVAHHKLSVPLRRMIKLLNSCA
ncbi:hypothetical protein Taro_009777, partial [Colocasia esculenta]|nr:hypothetical protein [Colocasia esculenta]